MSTNYCIRRLGQKNFPGAPGVKTENILKVFRKSYISSGFDFRFGFDLGFGFNTFRVSDFNDLMPCT